MRRFLWLFVLFLAMPALVTAQESVSQEAALNPNEAVYYTVESGDTLFGIAEFYETTIATLAALNQVDPDAPLYVGQILLVSGIPELPLGAAYIENPAILDADGLAVVPAFHTVQAGETLSLIGEPYNLSAESLRIANELESDEILVGQKLLIPGAVGRLIETPYTIQVGDTLANLAEGFGSRADLLFSQEIANPHNLIAGQTLALISRSGLPEPDYGMGRPHIVEQGETVSSIAKRYNVSPTDLAQANDLIYPTLVRVGQRLLIPTADEYRPYPATITTLQSKPDKWVQGQSFALTVETSGESPLTGSLTSLQSDFRIEWAFNPLEASEASQEQVAIIGLDAFAPFGRFRLKIQDETGILLDQTVKVQSGNYGVQDIIISQELASLLAPEIRATEDAYLSPIYMNSTPTPLWDTSRPFQSPLETIFTTARYGDARSYNGGPYEIFHTGVDYAAPLETVVSASEAGLIVFSDITNLRGNLIIIDHGLGVMTAYFHLHSRLVKAGETVERGQAIGSLGATGLVSGAHLHWDVRINDTPIDGTQWLTTAFP